MGTVAHEVIEGLLAILIAWAFANRPSCTGSGASADDSPTTISL